MSGQMVCAYCGKAKRWSDDFPSTIYAQCFTCALREDPKRAERIRAALAEIDAEPERVIDPPGTHRHCKPKRVRWWQRTGAGR